LLEAAGVAPEQVEMESRGEDEPLVSGTSEAAWAANRRVEISIRNAGSEGK
jgi:outer membrane protein OmpA-like peptidoglycan-associated protein